VVGRQPESAFLSQIMSWEKRDEIRGDQDGRIDLPFHHKLLPSP